MYVKAIITLLVIISILVIYLLFRGRSNGSRISDNSDIVDRIKDNNSESKDIDSKLENNSKSRRDITDKIESDNGSAGAGIDKALDILERAKDRQDT